MLGHGRHHFFVSTLHVVLKCLLKLLSRDTNLNIDLVFDLILINRHADHLIQLGILTRRLTLDFLYHHCRLNLESFKHFLECHNFGLRRLIFTRHLTLHRGENRLGPLRIARHLLDRSINTVYIQARDQIAHLFEQVKTRLILCDEFIFNNLLILSPVLALVTLVSLLTRFITILLAQLVVLDSHEVHYLAGVVVFEHACLLIAQDKNEA